MKQIIEEKLKEKFQPKFLEVKNNSHFHANHAGHDGSGETHFAIKIEADELKNLSAVNAHRKVNEVLKDEFERGMHALEIFVVR
jgi:BolA family transcriptional regulator, general stress-responsive regulator